MKRVIELRKKIFNILTVILFIYAIYLVYISYFQKLIYKNSDFLAYQITSAKDYKIASNCAEIYLRCAYTNTANISYFLRNSDRKKHIAYNKLLNTDSVEPKITNIKKTAGNVYIVYYNINEKSTKEERMVIRVNRLLNRFCIIYDSSYENMEV